MELLDEETDSQMTSPNFQYPDYFPSPDQEWATMLKRRSELLNDLQTRFQLSEFLTQQDPGLALKVGAGQAAADTLVNTHQVQGQNADGSLTKFQWSRTEPTHEETNALLGAAQFWGIPNAEKIPPKALRNIIEARRLSSAADAEPRGLLGESLDVGAKALAAIGLGTTQTLLGMAQKLPFIGNAVAENHSVQEASQWLHSLNEGVQAGMTDSERTGYRIAHGLGGLLGSAAPAGAAWKAAGAVGGLGAVTSGAAEATVIGRGAAAAAQGGIAAWLMAGGGDQSNEEAAWNVALGAGLGVGGVALAEALPRIAAKIKAAFPSRFDSYTEVPLDRRASAFRDNTVDAEWYFEADHQLPGQGDANLNAPRIRPPSAPPDPGPPPQGWNQISAVPEEATTAAGMDPFMAPRPNQPGTDLVVREPMALMSPDRAAITERILMLEEHRDLARRAMETDGLTGLGNKRSLARVQEDVDLNESLGWAVFDGKKFKLVNDTHGHGVGDQTLINFARAITQAAQEMNIPARIFRQGGDEFSAVVPKDQLQDFTKRVTQLSYQKVGGVETWLDGYAADKFTDADLSLMNNKRGGTDAPWTGTPEFDRANFERFAIESGGLIPRTGEFPAQVPGAGDYAATGLVPQGGDAEALARGVYPHSDLVGNPNRFGESYRATSPDLITQGNKPEVEPGVTAYTGQVNTPTPVDAAVLPEELQAWRQLSDDEIIQMSIAEREANPHWSLEPDETAAFYERKSARTRQMFQILEERRQARPGFAQGEAMLSKADEFAFAAQDIRERAESGRVAPHVGDAYTSLLGHGSFLSEAAMRIQAGEILSPAEQNLVDRLMKVKLEDPNTELEQAAHEGATLSKQATLLESSIAPELGAASEVTTADVVKAALTDRPDKIHIIQDVGDAGKTIRQLTQAQIEGRLMPHNFRLVERNGRMDLIVSDGPAVSNKQVKEYEQHGFFTGMDVNAGGRAGLIVKRIYTTMTAVYDPYGQKSFLVPTEQILPSAWGDASGQTVAENAPALYDQFKRYVQDYMEREAAKLPEGATIDTDWLSHETSSQLPRLLDSFLDHGTDLNARGKAAMESYFNIRRVHDFQQLAPQELEDLNRVTAELSALREANPVPYLPIEDIAAAKDFAYVSTPGTERGTLVDRLSDLRVPVAHEDAAYEFLRGFNREVPDYTPISDVPPEVMGSNPHAANPGDDLEPTYEDPYPNTRDSMDGVIATVERQTSAVEEALTQHPASGGSGWGGGDFPPPPESGGEGGGLNALPPGRRPSLGQQFQVAQVIRARELHEVSQKLDGFLANFFTPWRHVTAMIEHELKGLDITEGRLWAHQNAVSIGVTRAHNEALPWNQEWADITSQFRRKLLRNGTVTKIAEITDFNQRLAAMERAGYNAAERAAQNRISDFNDRFFKFLVDDPAYNLDDWRYVAGYMSHIRQRQGMPGIHDPFAGGDQYLPEHLKFFAEMARSGNMQFRQMDARVLGTKMIRAAFFKKFVDPPYHEMKAAWDDPRIPTVFRELATDWLEVVRTGHQPGGDAVVKGIRRMFNVMGAPVDDAEVAGLMNVGLGNMYRAQLGGRPDAIFRDAIQVYFTGVRIGFNPVNEVLGDFFAGRDTQGMIARAMEGGWLEKGLAKVANADIWEAGVTTPTGVPLMSESAIRRREIMARIGDGIWAATPKAMRSGLQGTRLDPLRYYTKLGEYLRVVSGEAGYRVASRALSQYETDVRAAFDVADPNVRQAQLDEAIKDLMKNSKARAYHQVVQDEFRRLVEAGQMKDAAFLLANRAADHQFRYGQKENPIGIRKMGYGGRIVMQFGSFTNQYVGEMRDMFMAPGVHPAEKVAMGLRYATVQAALGIAASYSGWRFGRWAWHQSLSFAGGPGATAIFNAAQAASGYAATAMGAQPSPMQIDAMRQYSHPIDNILGGLEANLNPYTSTIRTGKNLIDMAGSVNPIEGTARAIMTGEASIQPDMRQWLDSLGQTTIWPGQGMIEPGNINLNNRPRVRNPDGSISTVRSISVGIDGAEVLLPTVSEDGRIMSENEAVAQYMHTGRHLGKFRDTASANAYAQQLHQQQAGMLGAGAGAR